ncbi:hypothetical protein Hte_008810 [Hypoxylon texense]
MRPIQDFFRMVLLLIASNTTPSTALPTSTIGSIAPPTLDACKAQLRVRPDTTLFYSGGPSYHRKALDAAGTRAYPDGSGGDGRVEGTRGRWTRTWAGQFWGRVLAGGGAGRGDRGARVRAAAAAAGRARAGARGGPTGPVWDRVEWPSLAEGVEVMQD